MSSPETRTQASSPRDDLLWEHGVGCHRRRSSLLFALVLTIIIYLPLLAMLIFRVKTPSEPEISYWGLALGVLPWAAIFYVLDRFRRQDHLVADRKAWVFAALWPLLVIIAIGQLEGGSAIEGLAMISALFLVIPLVAVFLLDLSDLLQWQAGVMLGSVCPMLVTGLTARVLMGPFRGLSRQWRWRRVLHRRREARRRRQAEGGNSPSAN